MTEPRPADEFLDRLLKSKEVIAACRAGLSEKAADVIRRAGKGDAPDFLEWFEEWRQNDLGDPVEQLEGAAPDDDTFSIDVYQTGPLFWIKANEFDPICYFGSKDDAVEYAAMEFEGFISELAEREADKDEED
jgi:hypothetical protein